MYVTAWEESIYEKAWKDAYGDAYEGACRSVRQRTIVRMIDNGLSNDDIMAIVDTDDVEIDELRLSRKRPVL